MPLSSLIERSGSRSRSAQGVRDRSHVPVPVRGAGAAPSVLLIKDQVAQRSGLALLLRTRGFRIAGVAGSIDEGCRQFAARRPDVTVIDLPPDTADVAGGIGRMLAVAPEAAMLVYSGGIHREAIEVAASLGARGFALKAGDGEALFTAIRVVADGGVYVDPAMTSALTRPVPPHVLTPREREILQLLAVGLSGERAARRLCLSPETIRTHIRNAMHKLHADTRVHAVTLALGIGEIPGVGRDAARAASARIRALDVP